MIRIYLDDKRDTPKVVEADRYLPYEERRVYTHRTYTAAETIELLKTGEVTFISFDHDLGPAEAGTGYDVARWIEERAHTDPEFVVPDWSIHSANPVGANNIQRAMESAMRA